MGPGPAPEVAAGLPSWPWIGMVPELQVGGSAGDGRADDEPALWTACWFEGRMSIEPGETACAGGCAVDAADVLVPVGLRDLEGDEGIELRSGIVKKIYWILFTKAADRAQTMMRRAGVCLGTSRRPDRLADARSLGVRWMRRFALRMCLGGRSRSLRSGLRRCCGVCPGGGV